MYIKQDTSDLNRLWNYLGRPVRFVFEDVVLARFFAHSFGLYNRATNELGFKCNIAVPDHKTVTLEEAINDAIECIRHHSKEKNLFLLWSGGIDSTLVFYALLQLDCPFTVLMDKTSIDEHPKLWEKISSNYFKNVNYKIIDVFIIQ